MTGLDTVWPSRRRPDGISPFEPSRDLAAVVDLLHLGFADEMAEGDKQWLRDLAALSNAGPVLAIVARLFPPSLQGLAGFVWYEDGHLVANASLLRGLEDTWVVANVVTHPEHRRMGIAQELMTEIEQTALSRGARQLQLQVRDDNEPAQQLYRDLGYRAQGARTLLRTGSSRELPDDLPVELPHGIAADDLVAWGGRDADDARRMLRRTGALAGGGPPGQLRQAVLRLGWRGTLQDLMSGRKTLRWAVRHGRTYVGLGAARLTAGEGPHQVELASDPSWRGRTANPLVVSMIGVLAEQVEAPVEVELDTRETELVDELTDLGFARVRTLELLTRDLR